MSRDIVVAKRYAKALFELAQEQQVVTEIDKQLEQLVESFKNEPQFIQFLSSPDISAENKIQVLKNVIGGQVSAVLLHMLELLIVRGRQDIIAEMYDAFVKIADEAQGQARALVYTAKELSGEELDAVSKQFGSITGKTVIAKQLLEPSLIGGLQVRIGDRLYDGSLAGKLERLQKTLKSNVR